MGSLLPIHQPKQLLVAGWWLVVGAGGGGWWLVVGWCWLVVGGGGWWCWWLVVGGWWWRERLAMRSYGPLPGSRFSGILGRGQQAALFLGSQGLRASHGQVLRTSSLDPATAGSREGGQQAVLPLWISGSQGLRASRGPLRSYGPP